MAERWTLEQHNELRDAIATGAMSIRFKDKEIRFRTVKEMKALLTEMESDLGLGGANRRRRVRVPRFNNGL